MIPWSVWTKDASWDAWIEVAQGLTEAQANESAARRAKAAEKHGVIGSEFKALPAGVKP